MRIIILILLLVQAVPAQAEEHRSQTVLRHFQQENPCPATQSKTGACPHWIKDHIMPLCAGGPDSVENLKWSEENYAHQRDKQEWALCREMRKTDKSLDSACKIIEHKNLNLLYPDLCIINNNLS